MTAPIPYKEFESIVKEYGCTIERNGSHGKVKLGKTTISGFAVTHGKNTKGGEIKPPFVKQFLNNIKKYT